MKNKKFALLGFLLAFGTILYLPRQNPSEAIIEPSSPISASLPGSMNPDITQDNLKVTICDGDGGWTTALVRPPNNVTAKIKRKMMADIKTKLPPSAFQLDHIIPLTLGGAPLQPNLQLQPIAEARQKDIYEKHLWRQVCSGEVTLREAQRRISGDWNKYFQGSNSLGASVVDEDDI